MSELWDRLLQLVERLSPRERTLLGAGVTLTVAIVLWLTVTTIVDRRAMLAAQIAAHERDRAAMVVLSERLRALQAEGAAVQRRLAATGGDFSLFSHLESLSREIMSREQIASMNPSSRTVNDELRREDVEMRLSGVALRDVVALLHRVEKGDRPLVVSRLRLKKRYDESRLLDAVVVVSRLGLAAGSAGS